MGKFVGQRNLKLARSQQGPRVSHAAKQMRNNPNEPRLATAVSGLDQHLGGGLLPGTLTVIVGSTGIGKTQLGIQFANAGAKQEGQRGIIFDMCARGDSQSHLEYAQRIGDWNPVVASSTVDYDWNQFFSPEREHGEYLQVFQYKGRRVTRDDLDFDTWNQWQADLNARLASAIAFFYGNFLKQVRRVVVDGVEPSNRPADSVQIHLFEYVYHQVLRKDPEWVARDLFRQDYRSFAQAASENTYSPDKIGCLLLCTSHETMLDDLITRPLEQGDVLSNANTLIYMGRTRQGNQLGKALYIAKHRGSACSDHVIPYHIEEAGLVIDQQS
jgi:RecA/RadA recombinase